MKRTLILLFIFASFFSLAQEQTSTRLDSLLKLTSKYSGYQLVEVFIEIAKLQGIENAEQAHKSADEAIRLANQIKYQKGVGRAFLTKGSICNINNSPLEALTHYKEAERIFILLNDKANIAMAEMGIGDSYSKQGLFDLATNTYDEAISYFNDLGDIKSLANAYLYIRHQF